MEDPKAVKTTPAAAPETVVEAPTMTEIDAETRIAELEKEKAKIVEESANWKLAALKYKNERKNPEFFEEKEEDKEPEEDKTRRLIREELANNKIAQIDTEKDSLLKKLAKENKELKLANLNKTPAVPSGLGTENEGLPVKSTLITPEQSAAFKTRGWTDKDIERYKKNIQRYSGR